MVGFTIGLKQFLQVGKRLESVYHGGISSLSFRLTAKIIMSRPQKQHRNDANQLVNTRQALLDAALHLLSATEVLTPSVCER